MSGEDAAPVTVQIESTASLGARSSVSHQSSGRPYLLATHPAGVPGCPPTPRALQKNLWASLHQSLWMLWANLHQSPRGSVAVPAMEAVYLHHRAQNAAARSEDAPSTARHGVRRQPQL